MRRQLVHRDQPAPGHRAGELRLAGAEQPGADLGMDAVGADHVGRAHAVAVFEPHVGGVILGGDAGATAAELDGVGLDRAHRIRQQAVQVAPVQHHMRRAVALARRGAEIEPVPGLAGRPMPDHPPRRQHLDALQRLLQAERKQHAGAVRADLDAGADLLQLRRLLVDLDVAAALEQRQRRGQSADAAADDDDFFVVRHGSLELHAGLLHDLGPARDFLGHEVGEILRRAGLGLEAELGHGLLHLGATAASR